MTIEFKTEKATLVFYLLPENTEYYKLVENGTMLIWEIPEDENVQYIEFSEPHTLHGKVSELSEEVCRGLVDEWKHDIPDLGTAWENYNEPVRYTNTAQESILTIPSITPDHIVLSKPLNQTI